MALQPQNISVSFVEGLDTKSDRKQVLAGKFLTLENAIFQTPGKLRKRNGYMALPATITTGGDITAGIGTASFKKELLEFDGHELYSFSQSNQQWTPKGIFTSLELDLTPIVRNTFEQTTPDMAQHPDGLQLFTWEDSRGASRYSIVDSITGQAIVQDMLVAATASRPKAMTVGQYLIIFYIDTSTHHLRYIAIPVTNPLSPIGPTDFAIDVNVTHPNYDVAYYSSKLYVAYNNSSGGGGISVRFLNNFLVASAAVAVAGENANVCITIFIDSNALAPQLWIAYYNGTSVKYFILTATLVSTPVLAPTVIETVSDVVRVIGEAAFSSGEVWYEISNVISIDTLIRTATINNVGTVGTPAVFKRSVGISSKPFLYNGVYYFGITFDSVQQPTYFYVSQTGDIVSKAVPLNGGGLLTESLVPEAVQVTPGIITVATLQKDLLTTIGGTVYTQTGVVYSTLNFLSTNTFYRAEIANNLHINGGILEMYDGVNLVEHGFNVYPEGIMQTSSSPTGDSYKRDNTSFSPPTNGQIIKDRFIVRLLPFPMLQMELLLVLVAGPLPVVLYSLFQL